MVISQTLRWADAGILFLAPWMLGVYNLGCFNMQKSYTQLQESQVMKMFHQSCSNILSVGFVSFPHGYNMAATTLNLSSFQNSIQKQ